MIRCTGLASALLVLLTVSGASAASSDWPSSAYDAQGTRFNAAETKISTATLSHVHPAWAKQAFMAIAGGGEVFSVVQGYAGQFAVEERAPSGRRLHALARGYLQLGPASHNLPDAMAFAAGKLIIASASRIVAVETGTGKVVWRVPYGASSLTVAGTTLYTGNACVLACSSPAQLAIDLSSGRVLWRNSVGGGGAPVLIGGALYQSLTGGGEGLTPASRVSNARSGKTLMSLPFGGQWIGNGGSAYLVGAFAKGGGNWLGAVAASGRLTWRVPLGSGPAPAPAVLAYNTVFVPSGGGSISAVSASGRVAWTTRIGAQIASVAGANHVLFVLKGSDGELDALSMDTGKLLARRHVPGYRPSWRADVIVANGAVYVLDGHEIVALRV